MMRSFETQPGSAPDPAEEARRARQRDLMRRRFGQNVGAERLTTGFQRRAEEGGTLRKKYLQENPGDPEGAEILGNFSDFLETQRQLEQERLEIREKLQLVRKLTEFNARWTQYVHLMAKDPETLAEHWRQLESLARSRQEEGAYFRSRSGILSQVAMLKIFEELKLDHHLSTPAEDAYHKIDLWVQVSERDAAVQIKAENIKKVKIIEGHTADPLNVMIENHGQEVRASAGTAEDWNFQLKLKEYGREIGRPNLTGFFIVIPKDQIVNKVTGQPSPELVADVAAELRKMHYLPDLPGAADTATAEAAVDTPPPAGL